LVEALNNYEGAIVIVSHDPNMVERVADRLWLVKDGACTPFDGDIEDYRQFTIASKKEERKQEKQKKEKAAAKEAEKSDKKQPQDNNQKPKKLSFAQQQEKKQLEEKISLLETRKQDLEQKIASPEFYANDNHKVLDIQNQYQKTIAELEECETKWLAMGE